MSEVADNVTPLPGAIAAGLRDRIAAAPVAGKVGKDAPLPVEWADDMEPVIDGLWLIDDWLPAHGIAALYGHSGCGKSFLALEMAYRVALGWEFAGRRVEQGFVLYVCAEGATGFRNRVAGFRRRHEVKGRTPFAIVPTSVDMQAAEGDTGRVIEAIRGASEQAMASPALIVIDTLSKTFGAGKENTDDMAAYVANCQRVADAFQCCTLIVHHRPKDSESRDLRGHSSLRAGVETTILVEAGKTKVAETIKQKDGPEGERVAFTLQPVELGIDRNGKPVTTCTVDYQDAAELATAIAANGMRVKLTAREQIVKRAIGDAIAEHGQPIGEPVPGHLFNALRVGKMVEADKVADKIDAALKGVVQGDPDKIADTIARTRRRALEHMKAKEIIGTWNDWVWINYGGGHGGQP
jgi:KaiC/GvpD/RAD55 family RecA-like ATPase